MDALKEETADFFIFNRNPRAYRFAKASARRAPVVLLQEIIKKLHEIIRSFNSNILHLNLINVNGE